MVDLRQRAHARGEDDGPAVAPMMPQQVVIGERSGGDLVARRVEPLHEIDRRLVPTRGIPHYFLVATIAVDGLVIALAKLQRPFQISVRSPEWALPRLRELCRGVYDVHRALLELDGIASAQCRYVNQLLGYIHLAVVIDADLRRNETRMAIADHVA